MKIIHSANRHLCSQPFRRLFFVLAFFLSLSGCNKTRQTVSLDEARAITTEFRNTAFTPPPRSIDDLNIYLPELEIPATTNLDTSCDGSEDDGKWINRFKEYQLLYPGKTRIDRNISPMGNWFSIKKGWELNRGITLMEIRRGNIAEAILSQQAYLDDIPGNRTGANIPGYAKLSMIHVLAGDLNKARQALNKALGYDNQLYRRSGDIVRKHTLWLTRAKAELAWASGKLLEAESLYREAIKEKRELFPWSPDIEIMRSKLALVLMDQGRLLEAENELRQAIADADLKNKLDKVVSTPVFYRMAQLLLRQGRFDEAREFATAAIAQYQKHCIPAHSVEFAAARKVLADTYVPQKNWRGIIQLFSAIENGMKDQPENFKARFGTDLSLAEALIRTRKASQAEKMLENGLRKQLDIRGANDIKTAKTEGYLAIAQLHLDKLLSAKTHFKKSINTLLETGAGQDQSSARENDRQLKTIINEYINLLIRETGNQSGSATTQQLSAEIFRLTELLRASRVQQAVIAMGSRAAATNEELANLLRQEQNTSSRIKVLKISLLNAITASSDHTVAELRKKLGRLQQANVALKTEILKQFPDYAQLINPRPVTLEAAQKTLHANEALISTYFMEDKGFIWVVTSQGKPAFSILDINEQELADKVRELRLALNPTDIETLGDIPAYDLDTAWELYSRILEPLATHWKPAKHLIVVAHGALGYLPLSLLPIRPALEPDDGNELFSGYRKVAWLARSHSVTTIPSVSAFKVLRQLPKARDGRKAFIGFGDPVFNKGQLGTNESKDLMTASRQPRTRGAPVHLRATPSTDILNSATLGILPRLPETADELNSIARTLHADMRSDLFTGLDANENQVKQIPLERYKVVVFATHGLVPGDLDGLTQPALALSAPELAGTQGDGLLTMDEIMNLKLDADWVILSACNTGSGEGEGAEAVSGLGRAFFYAGTRALLVSNWPVESLSAQQLTTQLFKYQSNPDISRAEALRLSMMALMDAPGYYAHPIFWAPFSILGDGSLDTGTQL